MMSPEAYIRSYLLLFGNLSPREAMMAAKGDDRSALFDAWSDYLSALGLPDYRFDVPRAHQTHTLMFATLERLGEVLCSRAVENDLEVGSKSKKILFDPAPSEVTTMGDFAVPFAALHRRILGYPLHLAPPERLPRYFSLFREAEKLHDQSDRARISPAEGAWAAVCSALVRHPEFQLY